MSDDLDALSFDEVAIAIDRILAEDPRAAFDRLAPLLAPGLSARTVRARTAAVILSRIDDAIGVLSTDEDAPARDAGVIDPRWGDVCDAYARALGRSDAIALAEGIQRGIAWLAGNLPREPAPIVELGDIGAWSPLLVAGVVLPPSVDVVRSADWPKGIYRFLHSYGVPRIQAMIVGFAVRGPMPASIAVASEHEGLVVSVPCKAEPYLAGAPVLAFRARTRPWQGITFHVEPRPEITETIAYGEAHDRALTRVSHSYSGALPCLALLSGSPG